MNGGDAGGTNGTEGARASASIRAATARNREIAKNTVQARGGGGTTFGKGPIGVGTFFGTLLGGATFGTSVVAGIAADVADKALGTKDVVSVTIPGRRAGVGKGALKVGALGGGEGDGGSKLGQAPVLPKPITDEDTVETIASNPRRTKRGRASTILGGA